MTREIVLKDESQFEEYELLVLENQVEGMRKELDYQAQIENKTNELRLTLYQNLSRIAGVPINPSNSIALPERYWMQALDETYGKPGGLIQPSHHYLKYSLLKQNKDLKSCLPQNNDPLSKTLTHACLRSAEILRDYSSENTAKAYKSDLVYWHAWLSASGFSFREPVGLDHVKAFVIQHVEGLPHDTDQKLVEQDFKYALGTHKLTTVKRRVASLSVHLQLTKLSNPCQDAEVKKLLEKLTKKHGEQKRKGRAITLDVLNAMLETCGDSLIELRDKAILLFAWASGGRRRSEVSEAEMQNLEVLGNGNYLYHIARSKTDQVGKGHKVPINGRAANALRKWLETSDIKEGKIFRSVGKSGNRIGEKITDVDINRIVKRRCKKAGYDPVQYSAHSLRSGFITEAGRQGCALGDAMELSGHRNVNTAMGYYQVGNLVNNKAANMV